MKGGRSSSSCSGFSCVTAWVGVWVSGIDVTVVWSAMLSSLMARCPSSLSPCSIGSLLMSRVDGIVVWLLASLTVDVDGVEFSQCPRRRGRQFRHFLPGFLQAQFLHRPLALHRQHAMGMPLHTKWSRKVQQKSLNLSQSYSYNKLTSAT